jgi:hypothetical protein
MRKHGAAAETPDAEVSGEEEEKKRDEKNFGYRDLDGWKKY